MNSDTRLRPGHAGRRWSTGLALGDSWPERMPEDLLVQAVERLRAVAVLFASGVLLVNFVAALFTPDSRAHTFGRLVGWAPGVAAVAMALLVAWLTTSRRLSPGTKIDIGLAFEVGGSIAITLAQWWGLWGGLETVGAEYQRSLGVSWVAVWVVLFTVVVPSVPWKALAASWLSGAVVPVVVLLSTAMGATPRVETVFFFWAFVFPYVLLVPVLAFVGSRVVAQLGREVTRAREMGSYELVERLGTGGMGEVWRARHRMLARPAAVKVIRPESVERGGGEPGRIAVKRFEREAQATAAMRCPHTIDLYDFGVTDDGAFYYVMELLEGFDLETMVERLGPLCPERAIHILRQLCAALGEAHEHGLIHRDVKPSNVYVCRYGRELDWVKVLDFGLVKPIGDDSASPALTAETRVGGTPAYMAPEQALAERKLDGRADLYAVGCVAYFVLSGTMVFPGRSPIDVMRRHVNDPPEPLSRRAEQLVPPQLELIVLQCLEKNRANRPQTADELDERLAACGEQLPPWTRERARRWWDQHGPAREPAGAE